jgi:hypothetical protein
LALPSCLAPATDAGDLGFREQLRTRIRGELADLDLVGDLLADRRAAAENEDST